MQSNLPLPQEKKLFVIYRLEPVCLGSVGYKKINQFCAHITKNVLPIDSGFIKWTVLPRLKAKEREIEFRMGGKLLKKHQVVRYLAVFDRDYDLFEDTINQSIMEQIDHYFT